MSEQATDPRNRDDNPHPDEEATPSTALVVPGSGEVVDLANPDDATRAWLVLDELGRKVNDAKTFVKRALVQHARDSGGLTMRTAAGEVKVGEPVDITWNLSVLRELRAAGLPDNRWHELVTETVSVKVSATVAKQIAKAKPEYADIIGRAETRTPKTETVSVAARAAS
jgi:ribosomal protein L21E